MIGIKSSSVEKLMLPYDLYNTNNTHFASNMDNTSEYEFKLFKNGGS